ncbi:MAG: hypothetical protein LBV79_01100 [Candidatus Adiutrix sp.]|jgi:hypothetical protein|nr:hypothetical protein [Candidatus Adiutrix sp.]
MSPKKPIVLLLFLLTAALVAAQPSAAEAAPAGEAGLKLVPYPAGHMVFQVPESMALGLYVFQPPWAFQHNSSQYFTFTERRFDDPADGEKIFLDDFRKRLKAKSRKGRLEQKKEETLDNIFDYPAKMLSISTFYQQSAPDAASPNADALALYLYVKFPLGYLVFSAHFDDTKARASFDEALKDAKIKEFLEAVKTCLAAYRWTGGGIAANSAAFKTRFGEIDMASIPAVPGFSVYFQNERETAFLYINSWPHTLASFSHDRESLLRAGIGSYREDEMKACDCLPFVSFRPRAVAGLDGYELIIVRPTWPGVRQRRCTVAQ